MDKKDIINRIEQLLEEKHLSMNYLMTNADFSTTVYQWKSNRSRDIARTPSLKSIIKICECLDISLSYFFAVDKEEELSIKQKETANKLRYLSDEELEVINLVIYMFTKNRNSLNG